MRVVVKFPSRAYAELLAELEQMPPRERAERLRLLASIGLMAFKSGMAMPHTSDSQPEITSTPSSPGKDTPIPERCRRIRDKLKAGLHQ